jgi:acetylornithine/N-succinyldiaminopimelate aminotransferase
MSRTSELVLAAERHLYPNYRQPPVVLERGQGSTLWDTEGRRYIDLYAGIAVSVLGHAHPGLVAAIAAQAGRLLHQSNYFLSEPNVRLAARLAELTGLERAFFCNSGTEANEAALKLVRRHFFEQKQPERYRVLSFHNSFHGRTLGALAATGQAKYSQGFGPLGGVTHLPFGDLAAVEAALGPDVAAIITEPVQGEGGVVPAAPGFLAGLRALCDKSGALLVLDEIQAGMGRTGAFLACQAAGVRPDVVTLAKGLGGGVPIGAMLCREALKDSLPPGAHGSTFGGNPLASAAALATLDALEAEGLIARAARLGVHLAGRLDALVERYALLVERRGVGLLQAAALDPAVVAERPQLPAELIQRCREAGVLLTLAGGSAFRFTPALNISEAELDEGVDKLESVLEKAS